MNPFVNRVALITGGGRGIGRQLALDLAAEGAAIAAIDRDAEPLKQLAADLNGKPIAFAAADVTDRAALNQAVGEVRAQLGPIDLLIANAGVGRENSALSFRAEEFERQVRVNLIGVANSVEAVLPEMIERKSGHLVGISSLASLRGLPKMAGYCASKAGVNALFDTLRVELAPLGITCTTICPGWIRTDLTANIQGQMANLLDLPAATRCMVDAIRRRRDYCCFPSQSYRRMRFLSWLPAAWGDHLIRRLFARHGLKSV